MIILFILLIICVSTICLNNLYDKEGLIYAYVVFLNICYIFAFKNVVIYNFNLNLGGLLLPSIFILYYYLLQKNERNKMKIIKLSLISMILMFAFILISCLFDYSTLNNYGIEFNNVFISNVKMLIFYPIIITITQCLAIKLDKFIKKIYNNFILLCLCLNIILCLIFSIILIILVNFSQISINIILLSLATYLFGLCLGFIYSIAFKELVDKKVIK